jgi:sugar phosphate isomerase/epimerase
MPKISACSTLAFSLSSLEVALKHITGYGFEYVEIAEMLSHSKHFQVDTVDPVEVRRLLADYSLRPVAANINLAVLYTGQPELLPSAVKNHSSSETEEVQRAKQQRAHYRLHVKHEAELYAVRAQKLIDKVQAAGIPMLVLNVGRKEHIEDQDRDLKTAAQVIDEQAEYAKQAGIRILLEMPHVWQIYYDAESSKKMLAYLKSDNVGVVLDSTHWHVSGYDIDDYVGFLQDRLWHVHLRDAAGKDSPAGDCQLEITPGRGEVDFGLLGETLDKYDYRGTVTLETEYKNYQDPTEVDKENAFALDYLRSVGWQVEGRDS